MKSFDELWDKHCDKLGGKYQSGSTSEEAENIAQSFYELGESGQRAKLDAYAELIDYFAQEYPGTKDKTDPYEKLVVMLNTHIADRYKNGIVFLGHVNGNPTYQWLENCEDGDEALRMLSAYHRVAELLDSWDNEYLSQTDKTVFDLANDVREAISGKG